MYKNEADENPDEKPVDAVFISHYHADHFGLLLSVRDDVPVYASPLTKELICEVDSFVNRKPYYERKIRTLVIDPYTARCLQAFHKHYPSIPSYWNNNIAILSMGSHIDEKFMKHATGKNYSNHSVTLEEIYTHPEQYEVKVNFRIEQALFEHFKTDVMNLIFSQWEGYIKKNERLVPLHEKNLVKVIHCSGHAYKEDLDAFIKEVKPKRLIPIHTEHGELMLR